MGLSPLFGRKWSHFPVLVGKMFPFHYDLAFSAIALTDTGDLVTEAALEVMDRLVPTSLVATVMT